MKRRIAIALAAGALAAPIAALAQVVVVPAGTPGAGDLLCARPASRRFVLLRQPARLVSVGSDLLGAVGCVYAAAARDPGGAQRDTARADRRNVVVRPAARLVPGPAELRGHVDGLFADDVCDRWRAAVCRRPAAGAAGSGSGKRGATTADRTGTRRTRAASSRKAAAVTQAKGPSFEGPFSCVVGGVEGNRTLDLGIANAALSQLSSTTEEAGFYPRS